MAAQGLALVAVGFCKYTFEESVAGEYAVRLELLDNLPEHWESQRYIEFLEETGAEYIGSVLRWVYVRCKVKQGEFNLYSDQASRIKHLNRLLKLIAAIAAINLSAGLGNMASYYGTRNSSSLSLGVLSITVALLMILGFLRIYRKKKEAQRQQRLFE